MYDNISLSCVEPGLSSEWRVKRNTTTKKNQECPADWGKIRGSECHIDDPYDFDTGVYWCEFGAGTCSDAINISVTGEFKVQLDWPKCALSSVLSPCGVIPNLKDALDRGLG